MLLNKIAEKVNNKIVFIKLKERPKISVHRITMRICPPMPREKMREIPNSYLDTHKKNKKEEKTQKQKLSYKNCMSSVYHSSSDELWSRVYTINRTSGRAGTQGCPGRTISKPRKLNVLRSGPLSSRLFRKQIKTYLIFIFSSAYSSRASNPSLLPSAKMPSGISTKRL